MEMDYMVHLSRLAHTLICCQRRQPFNTSCFTASNNNYFVHSKDQKCVHQSGSQNYFPQKNRQEIMNRRSQIFLVFVFLIIAGWFYWFQWRPTQIRSKCQIGLTGKEDLSRRIQEGSTIGLEDIAIFEKLTGNMYLNCLNKHGLKE